MKTMRVPIYFFRTGKELLKHTFLISPADVDSGLDCARRAGQNASWLDEEILFGYTFWV